MGLPFIWVSCYQLPQATYPGTSWVAVLTVLQQSRNPCLVLLRIGFTSRYVAIYAGELLPHRFILAPTVETADRRFAFCCTSRRVAPPGR